MIVVVIDIVIVIVIVIVRVIRYEWMDFVSDGSGFRIVLLLA